MNDGAINRRKGVGGSIRKKKGELDDLQVKIVDFLKKAGMPVSTQDLSLTLGKPWHSIQNRCLKLQILKKINGFRIGRMNLWQIIQQNNSNTQNDHSKNESENNSFDTQNHHSIEKQEKSKGAKGK